MNGDSNSSLNLFQQVVKDLSAEGLMSSDCHYLDIIVKALVLLDMRSDNSSAICHKLDLIGHQFELKRTNQSIDSWIKDLQTNVRFIEDKLNESIRESKSNLAFESKMAEKIRFYSNKFKEYYSSVKSRENNLSKMGFTSDLRQKSIDSLREETQRLRNRLNDTTAKLSQYKDFNPSEADLKNRINEMQTEMTELDYKYFNDKI